MTDNSKEKEMQELDDNMLENVTGGTWDGFSTQEIDSLGKGNNCPNYGKKSINKNVDKKMIKRSFV